MKERKCEVDKYYDEKIHGPCHAPFGEWLASKAADMYGSWKWIIGQTSIIVVWMIWNKIPGVPHFDNESYQILNLMVGFIAAYTGTFLQMTQNRQAMKDRLIFQHDYETDEKAETEIREIKGQLDKIEQLIINSNIKKDAN